MDLQRQRVKSSYTMGNAKIGLKKRYEHYKYCREEKRGRECTASSCARTTAARGWLWAITCLREIELYRTRCDLVIQYRRELLKQLLAVERSDS